MENEPILKKYEDSPAARKTLFAFYRAGYPDMPEMVLESRFVWQSLQNPLEKDDERPLIWVLVDSENNIIGHNSILKYILHIDGRNYDGYCSTNLMVKPGLEGRGLGHKFIENNENLSGVAYAVGITEAASRAFRKRGWILVEDARLHACLLRPIKVLRFLRKPAWLAAAVSPVIPAINFVLKAIGAVRLRGNPGGLSFREIDRFLPEWDPVWQRYARNWAIHFLRSAETLNYKYFGRTDIEHSVLLFENETGPVGYAVYRKSVNTRRNISLGRIVDMIYDPEYGYRLPAYMVKIVKHRLLKTGVDGLVAVASAAEMAKALRLNGLIFSKVQPAIIKETDFRIKTLREKYRDIWLVTLGDSDMDNYW